MRKSYLALALSLILLTTLLCGCQKQEPAALPAATPDEKVSLVVAGGWTDCRALDVTAKAFTAKYPNCTIVYEYMQDFYASLDKRMSGSDPVDLFFTTNIQEGSELLPYALNLYGQEALNLSDTFDGLIQNFMFRGGTPDDKQLYAVPVGAEMRGLYVNKTLLDSLGIKLPTDQASLLAACETLKANGYIPMHGNPAGFAQHLLYPWICSLIANAQAPQAAYERVDSHAAGLSEMFREPLSFLYTLMEKGYYDYKTAQTDLQLFTQTTDEDFARDFLNIQKKDDAWVKADDVGRVAFLPSPMSLERVIAKTKDDYHSEIEYVFMLAPVGPEGGYAYLSPAHGIAVCKNSANTQWALKFLDFLFQPENNKIFAQAFNAIPNTKEAFSYIQTRFDAPEERISHLGQVTFSYGFYDVITDHMIDISKGNNPKYMLDDGAGNLSLHPLDYYMEALESDFQQQ